MSKPCLVQSGYNHTNRLCSIWKKPKFPILKVNVSCNLCSKYLSHKWTHALWQVLENVHTPQLKFQSNLLLYLSLVVYAPISHRFYVHRVCSINLCKFCMCCCVLSAGCISHERELTGARALWTLSCSNHFYKYTKCTCNVNLIRTTSPSKAMHHQHRSVSASFFLLKCHRNDYELTKSYLVPTVNRSVY